MAASAQCQIQTVHKQADSNRRYVSALSRLQGQADMLFLCGIVGSQKLVQCSRTASYGTTTARLAAQLQRLPLQVKIQGCCHVAVLLSCFSSCFAQDSACTMSQSQTRQRLPQPLQTSDIKFVLSLQGASGGSS